MTDTKEATRPTHAPTPAQAMRIALAAIDFDMVVRRRADRRAIADAERELAEAISACTNKR